MPPEPKWLGRFLNAGWEDSKQPITNLTWDEVQAFCVGMGGRLPDEAEWEYAARAGSTAARYGDIRSIAWYSDDSGDGGIPRRGYYAIESKGLRRAFV